MSKIITLKLFARIKARNALSKIINNSNVSNDELIDKLIKLVELMDKNNWRLYGTQRRRES